jgi:hypothetical protein
MTTRKKSKTLWTVTRAASELGFAKLTVMSAMRRAGHPKGRVEFTPREFVSALYGDDRLERLKFLKLRNQKLEIDEKVRSEDLIDSEKFFKILNDTLLPVRQLLMAMPHRCAVLCNPSDHQLAFQALKQWVSEAMATVRDAIKDKDVDGQRKPDEKPESK